MMDFLPSVFSGCSVFSSGFSSGIASGSLCSCSMRSPTVSFSGAETTVFGIIDFLPLSFISGFGSAVPGISLSRRIWFTRSPTVSSGAEKYTCGIKVFIKKAPSKFV